MRANEGLRRLRSDKAVNVPYALLSQSFRKIAIEALYPEDRATLAGWEHRVAALSGKPESLWRIAEWFTGDGRNYRKLREAKAIASLETQEGQVVLVPAACSLTRLPRGRGRRGAAGRSGAARRSSSPRTSRGDTPSTACARARRCIRRSSCGSPAASTPRTSTRRPPRSRREAASPTSMRCPVGFPVKIPVADLSPEFRPARRSGADRGAERPAGSVAVRQHGEDREPLGRDARPRRRTRRPGHRRDRAGHAGGALRLRHRLPRRADRALADAGARGADGRAERALPGGPVGRGRGVAQRPGPDDPPVPDRGRRGRRQLPLVPRQLGLSGTSARTAATRTGRSSCRCTRTPSTPPSGAR